MCDLPEWPASLLPQNDYVPEMNVEQLKEKSCYLLRWLPEVKLPAINLAEQVAEDLLAELSAVFQPSGVYGRVGNDPRDLSTSLINSLMDPDLHAGFRPVGQGAKPWPANSVPDDINEDYYKVIDSPTFRCIAIDAVHELKIPFPKKEGKNWPGEKKFIEDQIVNLFISKQQAVVKAGSDGSGGADKPKHEARLRVRHTPCVLNYWHISLQIDIRTPPQENWITIMKDSDDQNLKEILAEDEAQAMVKRLMDNACLQIFLDKIKPYDACAMRRVLPSYVYRKSQ